MTLEQASFAALEAARVGDLLALSAALEVRQEALNAGEIPTTSTLYAGEQTTQLLRGMVRELRQDDERLRRLRKFSVPEPISHVEVRG
jgi:hypothetical protein